MTAARDFLTCTGDLSGLPAGSVLLDAAGPVLEVQLVSYRDVRFPTQILRRPFDGTVVAAGQVQFPAEVVFCLAGESAGWRISDVRGVIVARQKEWSLGLVGPGLRTDPHVAHISKELLEILADPTDTVEWPDVAILALDGAWRTRPDADPALVVARLLAKMAENRSRTWPDWRTVPWGQPLEHVKVPDSLGGVAV